MTEHQVNVEYHPIWLIFNPAPSTTWPVREQDGMTPHGFIGHPDDDKFVIGEVVREGGFLESRLFPKPISIEDENPDLGTYVVLHKGKKSASQAKWIIQYQFKCREAIIGQTFEEGNTTSIMDEPKVSASMQLKVNPKVAMKSSPSKRSVKPTQEGETT